MYHLNDFVVKPVPDKGLTEDRRNFYGTTESCAKATLTKLQHRYDQKKRIFNKGEITYPAPSPYRRG